MPEHGEAMFVCRTWAELCLRLGRSVLCWPCLWLLVVSEKQRNVSVIFRHAVGWLRSTKWWGRVFRRSQKLATSASTSSFTQVFLRGSLTWGPNVLLRFYNSSAQRWKLQECAKLGGKRQVLSAPCSHLESL